jgi:hypothetical protein
VGVARPASHVPEIAALLHIRQQPHRKGIFAFRKLESCALLFLNRVANPDPRILMTGKNLKLLFLFKALFRNVKSFFVNLYSKKFSVWSSNPVFL